MTRRGRLRSAGLGEGQRRLRLHDPRRGHLPGAGPAGEVRRGSRSGARSAPCAASGRADRKSVRGQDPRVHPRHGAVHGSPIVVSSGLRRRGRPVDEAIAALEVLSVGAHPGRPSGRRSRVGVHASRAVPLQRWRALGRRRGERAGKRDLAGLLAWKRDGSGRWSRDPLRHPAILSSLTGSRQGSLRSLYDGVRQCVLPERARTPHPNGAGTQRIAA